MAYYFLNRAWVDENVKEITILAYKDLHKTHPKRKFLIMDCSKKKGGRIRPHRTHREGLSIDFATPLIRKNKPKHAHHNLGIWHYLMQFDESGNRKWHRNTSIDFDLMAQHILLLDKYARKKGMYVKKVILKINLKEEFFATTNGRKVKRRKIYFARKLPKMVDNVHDDHYHVDFAYLK
ncbi:MAG: hypothetical protein MRY83_08540 [Flavobacteriales bacterium]|nr:hypothetical protein [Flavobacteriales bacterium]